ncbi:ethanolamine utilization protein EutJ [Carboxydothermus ferrireducens]|uniref:Ethanolamine utilization protein EutJ n=1 Tax=Carboxydothermus ferrireducens DSM 11255 TaxID=1119529 RepID=A0ABX2R5V5_9THEO|nr:ethanolamine utilization protein EutJ [Carboxydothermus ferrireducens]NYE56553.1 ethanolamine utilization protein EutJ [Carboxydothermus ferrireducens DSM 11255]
MELEQKLNLLNDLIVRERVNPLPPPYKVGVDLGTADIVLVVTDQEGIPVAGALKWASVVKDGLVVDYIGAIQIVRELKAKVERLLGSELFQAATAIPPGTVGRNAEACGHVVAGAGLELVTLVDEPVAAARALGINDGIVVDIGGGTTGIAVIEKGKITATFDEPTGGTHLSLVLAGSYKIPFEEAETIKKDFSRHREIMPVVRPVIEKMALIVKEVIKNYDQTLPVYVVGGTAYLTGFSEEFSRFLGKEVQVPIHPLLVTPLGIALFG